jgi:LPS O-antigen subunit length determinant protein (WzzB/FepE family)
MEKPTMQHEQHLGDEIDLMDIIRVLWKRKVLIVVGTVLLTIAAAGVSFLLPKIYEVSTIIEPGRRPITNEYLQIIDEKVLQSPESIKEAVLGGAFDGGVQTKLQIPFEDYPEIKVNVPKNTELVIISIESSVPQRAKGVLQEVVAMISGNIEAKIEIKKRQIKNDIKQALVTSNSLLQQVKLVESQIAETRLTINKLETDRNKALASRANDSMAVLLYSSEIQNKQIYLNNLMMQHKSLEQESQVAAINVERQQFRFESVEATKVHKAPTIHPKPIKPKKKIIVALAFVGGVLMMVLMAFILEAVQRAKKVAE